MMSQPAREDEEEWAEDDAALEEEADAEMACSLRCLLCPLNHPGLGPVVSHMRQEHNFDLPTIVRDVGIDDDYELIRLLNFMRQEVERPELLERVQRREWSKDDRLLIPADPSDAFLTVDLDDLAEMRGEAVAEEKKEEVAGAEERAKRAEEAMAEMQRELVAMRRCMRRVVFDETASHGAPAQIPNGPIADAHLNDDNEEEDEPPALIPSAAPSAPSAPQVIVISRSGASGDTGGRPVLTDSYFESYDRPGIHEEMLQDRVRTESYRNFILDNASSLFANRRVLDLGCGTGILSMVAARAGASRVVAVDRSDVIFTAMEIARENQLEEKIEFKHGRVEDLIHELGEVDVVVSEWMGYFLLFESMLDSVLFCRERISPKPRIFPRFYSLRLVGLDDQTLAKEKVKCWDDFYGFRFSALRRQLLAEAVVKTVPGNVVATDACEICAIDLEDCGLDWQLVDSQVTLTVTSSTAKEITAVAGYFDVSFENADRCDQEVKFSTGPLSTPTHWKQTVFVFQNPLAASSGETLSGRISVRRSQSDHRSLSVDLCLSNAAGESVQQQYSMD